MIIETPDDVTAAVLQEMHRTPDARTRELLALLVKHLHAFVREARLTEREPLRACRLPRERLDRPHPASLGRRVSRSLDGNNARGRRLARPAMLWTRPAQ